MCATECEGEEEGTAGMDLYLYVQILRSLCLCLVKGWQLCCVALSQRLPSLHNTEKVGLNVVCVSFDFVLTCCP